MQKTALATFVVLIAVFFIYKITEKPGQQPKTISSRKSNSLIGERKMPATFDNEINKLTKPVIHIRAKQLNQGLSAPYSSENQSFLPKEIKLPVPAPQEKLEQNIQSFLATRNTPSEFYNINAKQLSTITGKEGTSMKFIPSTFKIDDSTYYDGPVKIEMKEINKRSQMVFSNFSTMSGNDLLESAGMIYWNATTEGGRQLIMDTGSNVLLTFRGNKDFKDYQLFSADGSMNWQLCQGGFTNSRLAILPESSVPFRHFKIKKKIRFLAKETTDEWNGNMEDLRKPAYVNTSLCTMEFLERLEVIRNMGWDMQILQFYLDNPNNLNQADSMALAQTIEYGNDLNKSNYKLSKRNLCTGLSKKKWIKYHEAMFRNFYVESRSYIDKIILTRWDLRSTKAMMKKIPDGGYIDWITYHPKYNYKYSQCNNEACRKIFSKRGISTFVVSCNNYNSITFKLPKMGYINCDRFYNQPVKRDVFVKINNLPDAGDVYSFLVFKDINSMMSGYENPGGIYFSNIPVGTQVTLVVIGNKDGKTSFAIKDITIQENIHTNVTLQPAKKEEIEDCIKDVAG